MSLPFDSSDPAIRLMLKHVRLQALTPMAILVNLTATIVSALVLNPSIKRIQEIYATPFNIDSLMLSMYWLGTFVLLIGYCFILMIAKKPETRETLVKGVGLRLVFIQWAMAGNVVAFTVRWFKTSLVLTSISLALLLWIHISLHYYPTASTRPLDVAFIHAPIRLLLVVTFLQDFPQVLFVVVGWTWNQVKDEQDYGNWAWQAVAFIVSFNLVALLHVGYKLDLVTAVGAMWIVIGQILHRPKAVQVSASLIAFAVLYPVVFIAMIFIWRRIRAKEAASAEGRIALPSDEEEEAEVARARARAANHHNGTSSAAV